MLWTVFSRRELASSEWLELVPDGHHGYPQLGEDDVGYLAATYSSDDRSSACGVGCRVRPALGVGQRAVTDAAGDGLRTVMQLVTEDEVPVAMDGLTAVTRGRCGRDKFEQVVRGPSPALREVPPTGTGMSVRCFGSGSSAGKLVFVAQDLRAALVAAGVRDASLWPAAG